jgi:hypothetical protein
VHRIPGKVGAAPGVGSMRTSLSGYRSRIACSQLTVVADAQFDIVIANYVLMDTPELDATMHRNAKRCSMILSRRGSNTGKITVSDQIFS